MYNLIIFLCLFLIICSTLFYEIKRKNIKSGQTYILKGSNPNCRLNYAFVVEVKENYVLYDTSLYIDALETKDEFLNKYVLFKK